MPTSQEAGPVEKILRTDKECIEFILSYQRHDEKYGYWEELFSQLKEIPLVLEHHKIKFLMRKKERFTIEKKFKCSVCTLYFSVLGEVNEHVKDIAHLSRLQKMRIATTCILTPELPLDMRNILTQHLEEIIGIFGLGAYDILYREKIHEYLNEILKKKLPGAYLNVFGSTYHEMGLKSSDLNLSLMLGNNMEAALTLSKVAMILKKEDCVHNLKTYFNHEYPYITLNYESLDSVLCKISLNNEHINGLSRLLLQYSVFDNRLRKLSILLRHWGQICKLDLYEEGSLPSFTLYMMVVCYLLRCRKVLPIIPDSILKDFKSTGFRVNPTLIKWKSDDNASLSELWRSLIVYYAADVSDHKVIYITQTRPTSRKLYASKKRILVFDPFHSKIIKGVCTGANQQFINYCFKNTQYYYSIPHTKEGPIFGQVRVDMYPDNSSINGLKDFFVNQSIINSALVKIIPFYDNNYITLPLEYKQTLIDIIETRNPEKTFVNTAQVNLNSLYFSPGYRKNPEINEYVDIIVRPRDAEYLINMLDSSQVYYKFDESSFTLGIKCPKCCIICFKEDHTKSKCPEDVLPPLEVLSSIDEALDKAVSQLCMELHEAYKPSQDDNKLRNKIVSDIELYLISEYPSIKLTLFGSSRNGFGLKCSDIDICITFDDNNKSLENGLPNHIEKISRKLSTCPNLKNLVCISTAKVPIIKFVHEPTQLEGDISLCNMLAQENTALLKTYSQIDQRVQILGTMIKKFAKICNIGDASKGSLSSYSYTIMAIFYLQQCSPPVLPVLQELPTIVNPVPIRMIDDCNCYYFNDLERLEHLLSSSGAKIGG